MFKHWITSVAGTLAGFAYFVTNTHDSKHAIVAVLMAVIGYVSKDYNK